MLIEVYFFKVNDMCSLMFLCNEDVCIMGCITICSNIIPKKEDFLHEWRIFKNIDAYMNIHSFEYARLPGGYA